MSVFFTWTLLCKFKKDSRLLLRNRLGILPQVMTAAVAAFERVLHVLGLLVFNQLNNNACGVMVVESLF